MSHMGSIRGEMCKMPLSCMVMSTYSHHFQPVLAFTWTARSHLLFGRPWVVVGQLDGLQGHLVVCPVWKVTEPDECQSVGSRVG